MTPHSSWPLRVQTFLCPLFRQNSFPNLSNFAPGDTLHRAPGGSVGSHWVRMSHFYCKPVPALDNLAAAVLEDDSGFPGAHLTACSRSMGCFFSSAISPLPLSPLCPPSFPVSTIYLLRERKPATSWARESNVFLEDKIGY